MSVQEMRSLPVFGIGIAAAEDGAEAVVGDVVGVLDEELVGLGHLPDFFVERHLFQDGYRLIAWG